MIGETQAIGKDGEDSRNRCRGGVTEESEDCAERHANSAIIEEYKLRPILEGNAVGNHCAGHQTFRQADIQETGRSEGKGALQDDRARESDACTGARKEPLPGVELPIATAPAIVPMLPRAPELRGWFRRLSTR